MGNQDNTSSEKPAMQNSGSQLMSTSSLLTFGFKPPQRTNGPPTTTICTACRLPFAEGERRHNHHVSYARDWTVPVHVSCYKYIHVSNKYPHLKPPSKELNKYRKSHHKCYNSNKDRLNKKERQRHHNNKNKENKRSRSYYHANKDKTKERNRRWRQANKNKVNERERKHRLANRNKLNE